MASGFVVWLAGTIGSAAAYRHGKNLMRKSRFRWAVLCFAIAAVAGVISLKNMPTKPAVAAPVIANDPIGIGKGIHPGRVVWVHDPNATSWAYEGTDTGWDGEEGTDVFGYWWESSNTDQNVVDSMMSSSIRALAGEVNDFAAWDTIFRHFNQNRLKPDIGYQPGEKITIKLNMVTVNKGHNNIDASGNQINWKGWVNTSPQMVLALLDQLVNVVGVDQNDITVGDTTCDFPNHYWDYCRAEFPDVHYLAWTSDLGRRGAVSSQGDPCETPIYWSTSEADGKIQDYLPLSYAEAEYLINFACLKGHSSGVTLCAKNHYGSLIRLPNTAGYYDLHLSLPNPGWTPGTGYYRAHVDITGHSELGGKTVLYLIDGLYGGYYWEGRPFKWNMPPFNGDWPSSLFVSQDPVAIDSVAYDFLRQEWPRITTGGTEGLGDLQGGEEDYLHEAAIADSPDSETFYDPERDGTGLQSLGVHEHWNNHLDKYYSGNGGIELLALPLQGDFDGDGDQDATDLAELAGDWLKCTNPGQDGCLCLDESGSNQPWTILVGTAVIDGNLNDWENADWIPIDKIYNGSPQDVTGAYYSLKWSSSTNLIYMALKCDDSDLVLQPFDSWNTQDDIELYVDAGNSNVINYGTGGNDQAQQFFIGNDGMGETNTYCYFGSASGPPDVADETGGVVAKNIAGHLTYEIAIVPWSHRLSDEQITLESGLTVGIDVAVSTLGNSYPFGMLCNNQLGNKYLDAGQLQDHILADDECGLWGYLPADLNRDCVVNMHDFAIFAKFWISAFPN